MGEEGEERPAEAAASLAFSELLGVAFAWGNLHGMLQNALELLPENQRPRPFVPRLSGLRIALGMLTAPVLGCRWQEGTT